MTRIGRGLGRGGWSSAGSLEKAVAVLAISLASLLPLIAMVTRLAGVRGIPGSVVFVQQLTLWIAFVGAALAAAGDQLRSDEWGKLQSDPVRSSGTG